MGPLGSGDTAAIRQAVDLSNTLPAKGKGLNGSDFYLARTASGSLELVKKKSLKGIFLALCHRFWWKATESRLNVGLNWEQARSLLKRVVDARDESWTAVAGSRPPRDLKEKVADLADFLTDMQVYVAARGKRDISLTRSLPSRRIDRLLRGKVAGRTPQQEAELRQKVQKGIHDTLSVSDHLAEELCTFVFDSPEKEFLIESVLDEELNSLETRASFSQVIWRAIRFEKDPALIDQMTGWIKSLSPRTKTPPSPVAIRELTQVFGDHFVGGLFAKEALEGDVSAKNYASLLSRFLETAKVEDPRLQRMKTLLDRMQKLSTSESVATLQHTIRREVKDPETHGCLLSGGWKGHCVVFEIERQANGKYTFRVYNKGKGISYHKKADNGIIEKAAPCLAIRDISENIMLSLSVLGMLQGMVEMDPEGAEKPQDLLAGVLLPSLGGVAEPFPDDVLGAVSPQRSGTCTYLSLDAFLARSCTQHEYRELKFRFRTFLLDAYRGTLEGKIDVPVTDETYPKIKMEISVVQSAVAHYADRLQKLRSDIPAADVRKAQEQILQYEFLLKKLAAQVQAYEEHHGAEAAQFLKTDALAEVAAVNPPVSSVMDPLFHGLGATRTWSREAQAFLDFVRQKLPKRDDEEFSQALVASLRLLSNIPPENRAEYAFCFDILCRSVPSVSDLARMPYPDPVGAFQEWHKVFEQLSKAIYNGAQPETYLQFFYAAAALYFAYRQIPNVPEIPLGAFFPPQLHGRIGHLTTTDPFWAYRLNEIQALCQGDDPWPSVRVPPRDAEIDQTVRPGDIGEAVWGWLQREEQRPLLQKLKESVAKDRARQAQRLAEEKADLKGQINGTKDQITALVHFPKYGLSGLS